MTIIYNLHTLNSGTHINSSTSDLQNSILSVILSFGVQIPDSYPLI